MKMLRALAESEEQAVRRLFNSTADQLGIARPLDPAGWYSVKDYLRSQRAGGVPGDWTKDYDWLHYTACSDLAIDPHLPRKGVWKITDAFLSWIGSPRDRHRAESEFMRGVFSLMIASLFGTAALLVARYFGISGIWPFVVADVIGLILLNYAISADTLTGAQMPVLILSQPEIGRFPNGYVSRSRVAV
jgi:hypothetical protein